MSSGERIRREAPDVGVTIRTYEWAIEVAKLVEEYERLLSKAYSLVIDHDWSKCNCHRCRWVKEYKEVMS